ncbi:MAG: thioredoxin-disulfide reductase [Actinomycetota bacterium]
MSDLKFDVAIIGGGPAGMAAGLYASRGGLKAVLLEKGLKGGPYSITDEIENYPGFPEGIATEKLMDNFQQQAERFGLTFKSFCPVSEVKSAGSGKILTTDDGEKIEAKAVIIATGAAPSKLGVPGEKEFAGRGVSYCATCDGPLFKDKKVLIVGGGNAAVEEAIFLTKFCSEVTIVHRRDQLRADKVLQERAQANPKIKFLWHSTLQEIHGDVLVSWVMVRDVVTDVDQVVNTDGVFIFVGTSPVTEFLPAAVKRDERGFVVTDDSLMTSEDGVFAAGDCRANGLKQIIWAAAEGAKAAIMTERYLEQAERKGKGNG